MKKLAVLTTCLLLIFGQSGFSQNWISQGQSLSILPAGYGIYSISVVDQNVIWAVAFDQPITIPVPANHIPKIVKSTDGGTSWAAIDIEEATGRICFDIQAFSADTAWITTQNLDSSPGRGLFKTVDGGLTWTEEYSHPAGGVWVRFFDRQKAVAINRSAIARTEDGGANWNLVPQVNIPAFLQNESTLIGTGTNSCKVIGSHVWFGTDKGRVYHSKDYGNTWTVAQTSLGSNALIISLAFSDTLNGIAVDVASTPSVLARTRDGGQTWGNVNVDSSLSIANLEYVAGTDSIFIAASDVFMPSSVQVSAWSADYGKSWQIIDTGIPRGPIQFISPNLGWSAPSIANGTAPVMFKWNENFALKLADQAYKGLRVFPNPFKDKINLTFHSSGPPPQSVEVWDLSGKLLFQAPFGPGREHELDLGVLPTGVYELRVYGKAGNRTLRVMKGQ